MIDPAMRQLEERVLLLAPTPKDAAMTQRILGDMGIACWTCSSIQALRAELTLGAGAVLLTEEVSSSSEIAALVTHLRNQRPWSDLPIVVLAAGGANSSAGRSAMELLGNVTVLERPVQMASLVSVVRTLLRSRQRQYQIREHLQERGEAAKERERLLISERAARSEAERVGRVKDEFLATLSHELRTPLNAILGWSQILGGGNRNEEDLTLGIEAIERNARAQTQIIEDLLDMSRIISGKIRLDMRRMELAPVIHAALHTVQPAASAKRIRVDVNADAQAGPIWGDHNRLQQVLWNLLSNSIKFTPEGGHVRVSVTQSGAHQTVAVADDGEGIKQEFLPHVFERFQQADASSTRRHGGLGLGLAIVKQLIELHGGKISVKSQGEGKGATFMVTLPVTQLPDNTTPEPDALAAAPAIAPSQSPAMPTLLQGVRVLLVDDEPDGREVVKRMLEHYAATVVTASSAAEALEEVLRQPPNILLSDICMPEEDGYSLIRKIRALDDRHGGDMPAVALTAYARAEDRRSALLNGFHMHIAKPVEPATLIATLSQLLHNGHQENQGH